MVNWDTITRAKGDAGLGLKKMRDEYCVSGWRLINEHI